MNGSIAFTPLLPWPLLATAAIVATALVAVVAGRGGRGWVFRGVACASLIAALANPKAISEQREPRADVALIVVDTSPSQSVGERSGQTAEAEAALRASLAKLPGLEIKAVRAGTAGDSETRVFAALNRALGEMPRERLAGVVVVTDGQVHDRPPPDFLPVGVPLHVFLSGAPDERDRRLTIDQAPAYGIVGTTVRIAYTVVDRTPGPGAGGASAGAGRATVRLSINGTPAEESDVAVNEPNTFLFTLDRAGPSVVEVEVEPALGEISTLNNRVAVAVNGVRDRLRVLLVSGQPHPGERAWRNLLKSDPAVDLVHFTILRPPDKEEFTPLRELSLIVFPVRELFSEKLYDFDLVVFDRFVVRGVLTPEYLERIAAYLGDGGAVLLSAGPEFAGPQSLFLTALGESMPAAPTGRVVEQAFRPTLSDIGRRHPVSASLPGSPTDGNGSVALEEGAGGDPPWGPWFRLIEASARRGDVLMQGAGGRPLLVVDRVGKGRIAQLMSDQMWLWGRGFDGGGPQGELSRRLVHWLMKEPELEEESLRANVADGRLRVARHSLTTEAVEATVTSPTGARQTISLEPGADGIARREIDAGETGLYRVEDGTHTAWAAAGAVNPPELADLRASAQPLATIAAATGGGVAWIGEGLPQARAVEPGQPSAGRGWIGLRRNHAYSVNGVSEIALLPALLFIAAVLGGLGAAWWREGR